MVCGSRKVDSEIRHPETLVVGTKESCKHYEETRAKATMMQASNSRNSLAASSPSKGKRIRMQMGKFGNACGRWKEACATKTVQVARSETSPEQGQGQG